MNKKSIGKSAEDFVCEYLKSKNYLVLEQNWSCGLGEIDIIAKDNNELVFVEVRCKKKTSKIKPEETVSFAKRQKIAGAIEEYIRNNKLQMPVRCDFVGVVYSLVCDVATFEIENHIIGFEI